MILKIQLAGFGKQAIDRKLYIFNNLNQPPPFPEITTNIVLNKILTSNQIL